MKRKISQRWLWNWKKISDEIIVCNDGSSDLTGEIAEKMGVIVINHEKNLGYGAGISSIIKKSKTKKVRF